MKNKILSSNPTSKQVALFYLGQEGFIIKYNEKYILLDGYLSDYVDRNCCSEQVHWVRKYPAPIDPSELDFIDYVFCSHDHYDHADPDTLSAIAKVNNKAKYIVPAPIVDTIKSYGINADDIIPAFDGKAIELDGVSVMPIASAHEQLNADENGNYREMGYKLTLGETTLYHAGDCCIYDGLVEKLGKVDIAMLPVNGRSYFKLARDIVGNMTGEEAVELARLADASLLVPLHFDLYACNGVSAAYFSECVELNGGYQAYHIFQPAEKYIFEK